MQENSFQVQKGYPIGCCGLSQHKQRRKQYDNRIWVIWFVIMFIVFLVNVPGKAISNKMRELEAEVRREAYNKQSKEQKPRTFSTNNGRTEVTIDENNLYSVDVYNFTTQERHHLTDETRKGLEVKINDMFKQMLDREEKAIEKERQEYNPRYRTSDYEQFN